MTTSPGASLSLRIEDLRSQVQLEATEHGEQDLAQLLDGLVAVRPDGPVRVIVAGSLKRGKSTLVNSLVGRPLLSPVGVDVTTACWVEIGYGDDQAIALVANPDVPAEPIRRPIAMTEVEQYVALHYVSEPVLGVEVRVRAPLLKDLVLVDTPGVGGLEAGHSRTTLSALAQADALLFVCDSTQPILAPEVAFLASAVEQVVTVIIAVTKSDTPGYEVVLEETRNRLARNAVLATIPVFAVAAPLADEAHDIDDAEMAREFAMLSGLEPLSAALRQRVAGGRERLRTANRAQTTASVARILGRRLAEQEADLAGDPERAQQLAQDEARLTAALQDRHRLSLMVAQQLAQLRTHPRDTFEQQASQLGRQYRGEAERGPAGQLATLAARMSADLTAVGVTTLEKAGEQGNELLREILDRVGSGEIAAEIPLPRAATFNLSLRGPEPGKSASMQGLTKAGQMFPTIYRIIAGSTLAVSVLTGPGVVAASLALAACTGWWRVRGSEQERRAALRTWAEDAIAQASGNFGQEMDRRTDQVQRYLDAVLPELLDARQEELARVRGELSKLRRASAEARRQARSGLAVAMDLLTTQAKEAAELARALTLLPEAEQ